MNGATSLASARRWRDPRFATSYFVGYGLDIGCGPDPLEGWPLALIRHWDMQDGDATTLPGIRDESCDFVYSSHCLEHLERPICALLRWAQVLKPRGYLILVVPDFQMYERGHWPSNRQPEGHKTAWMVDDLYMNLPSDYDLVKLERLEDRFQPDLPDTIDQTTAPYNAECGIELIARKR